jgi:hypothetical protein
MMFIRRHASPSSFAKCKAGLGPKPVAALHAAFGDRSGFSTVNRHRRQVSYRPHSRIHHMGRGHRRGDGCEITPVDGPRKLRPVRYSHAREQNLKGRCPALESSDDIKIGSQNRRCALPSGASAPTRHISSFSAADNISILPELSSSTEDNPSSGWFKPSALAQRSQLRTDRLPWKKSRFLGGAPRPDREKWRLQVRERRVRTPWRHRFAPHLGYRSPDRPLFRYGAGRGRRGPTGAIRG